MRKMFYDFMNAYRSIWMYAVFGAATTGINIAGYYICARVFQLDIVISNILAWSAAVVFAYATNRKWVFESRRAGIRQIAGESIIFFVCRLATGVLDMGILLLGVDIMKADDMAVKIISNGIVIVTNYIASKFIVFA